MKNYVSQGMNVLCVELKDSLVLLARVWLFLSCGVRLRDRIIHYLLKFIYRARRVGGRGIDLPSVSTMFLFLELFWCRELFCFCFSSHYIKILSKYIPSLQRR